MIVDQLTTLAFGSNFLKGETEIPPVCSYDGQLWPRTASIVLNLSYLAPLALNTTAHIDCNTIKLAGNLVYLDAVIKSADGSIGVTALHIKKIFR